MGPVDKCVERRLKGGNEYVSRRANLIVRAVGENAGYQQLVLGTLRGVRRVGR